MRILTMSTCPASLLFWSLVALLLTLSDALKAESRSRVLRSKSRPVILPESKEEWALKEFRFPARGQRRPPSFLPTPSHCCDVGDVTARRRQGCTLAWHAANRARTVQNDELRRLYGIRQSASSRAQNRELGDKVASCYQSPFSRNFKKCCFYRTQYMKAMHVCRSIKRGKDRKQCRQKARDDYL